MEGKSDPYVQINLTSISHPGLNLTQKWSKGLKVHESTRRRYRRNTSDLDLVLAFCADVLQSYAMASLRLYPVCKALAGKVIELSFSFVSSVFSVP